jgi:hypothetical protein
MSTMSWQTLILLLALIGSTTFLVARGSVPSHAFTMLLGGFITALAPGITMGLSSAIQARRISRSEFTRDEVPTDKGGRKVLPDEKKD